MTKCKIVVQLNSIKTLKDGGGKIVFEFGNESLEEIQKLQTLAGDGDINFVAVLVPFKNEVQADDEWPETTF